MHTSPQLSDFVFPCLQLEQNAKADPSVSQRVNGSYKFVISGGAGGEQTWLVNLKNGQAPSIKKADGDADCTITMKEDDFMALMQGKIDGQNAFMQGKLKLKGSIRKPTINIFAQNFYNPLPLDFMHSFFSLFRYGSCHEVGRARQAKVQAVTI